MEINKIKETCLYVKDLNATRHFYESTLSFPVIGTRKGRHVFFRAGTSVLLCFIPEITKAEQELPPHYAIGPQHIAFEVPKEAYTAWKEKITLAGVKIIHEQSWNDQLQSFYFHDPDGNLLEIIPEGMWDSRDTKIAPD
ncbi:MAG: VOC family protein [Cyclobacteriaceae bacterium]